ncbi:hypothetical protein Cus16_3134 [Curtobacterium sp. ER1/6]|nr:hypothetical protein Cus16_3134 [Curtobacterium sp. ER1/6]
MLLRRAVDPDDAEALVRRRPCDLEAVVERLPQPPLQGVPAEVLRHDEPGVPADLEPGEPGQQDRVQLVLAHADGRVRPDRPEPQVRRDLVGQGDGHVRRAGGGGVRPRQTEHPLVDVDTPHGGTG